VAGGRRTLGGYLSGLAAMATGGQVHDHPAGRNYHVVADRLVVLNRVGRSESLVVVLGGHAASRRSAAALP